MKEILSSSGFVIKVDDDDYEHLMQYKWSISKPGHRRTTYAMANLRDSDGSYYPERMHRLIMKAGKSTGVIVDHINGDGLDNRKENLRIVTSSQNATNVEMTRGNTSGYKGVSYRKERNKWKTEIRKDYKTVFSSMSSCLHLAGLKYNQEAMRIHGEYVWLNEVKECGCIECATYKRSRSIG